MSNLYVQIWGLNIIMTNDSKKIWLLFITYSYNDNTIVWNILEKNLDSFLLDENWLGIFLILDWILELWMMSWLLVHDDDNFIYDHKIVLYGAIVISLYIISQIFHFL